MEEGFPGRPRPQPARRRSFVGPLAFTVTGFVLGGLAVWTLATTGPSGWNWLPFGDPAAEPAGLSEPEPTPTASPDGDAQAPDSAAQAREAAQQVAVVAQQQGGLDQRVAAMEQRLTRLDLQAQAAAGNATRAEGLLIAFAARRTLERGEPLGYLADQLRLRFGDARPNAVEAVLEAAQDPVTLDQLVARLDGLSPALERRPRSENAFNWLSREVSELFVVRRADAPSPAAVNRLRRARLFLESGRASAAAAEVRQLPNAEAAQDWIADAERYAAASRALDLLETTAILEPRRLQDDAGQRVEQPSPVQ